MKINIVYLLLIALLGITVSASIAQQNQNVPKTGSEVEKLKIQLQTVENEKMEIETKLAEANAKLINTDIDKLKGELRESNNDWLRAWSGWFLTIIGIFAAILLGVSYVFWFWLKSKTDRLIENEVEKSLKGFQETVGKVNILEGQLGILKKEHAASMLENFNDPRLWEIELHPEQIKSLPEEVLLEVFNDKTRDLDIRITAIEVLAARKSPQLVSPVLEFLNSFVDSEFVLEAGIKSGFLYRFIKFVGEIYTEEAYHGLKKFLDRLVRENLKYKHMLLSDTLFSFTVLAIEMNMEDAVSVLKLAISHLKHVTFNLSVVTKYFDLFNEPDGIKEILTNGLTDRMPEVETRCLELLEKYDPDFVNEWKAQKATANTESEES